MDANISKDTKINDLTVEEFKSLMSNTIKDALEDLIEEIVVLSNRNHSHSVEDAKQDYKNDE